jgi:hypothetical protein
VAATAVAIGATSLPWHISSKTKYPDLGAEWLNYVITSSRAKALMYSQQQIPSDRRAKAPSGDPYLAQVGNAFKLVADDDGLLLYTDWASPSMYTTLQNQYQLLLAGRQTPAGMAKAVQDDWAKFDKTADLTAHAGRVAAAHPERAPRASSPLAQRTCSRRPTQHRLAVRAAGPPLLRAVHAGHSSTPSTSPPSPGTA